MKEQAADSGNGQLLAVERTIDVARRGHVVESNVCMPLAGRRVVRWGCSVPRPGLLEAVAFAGLMHNGILVRLDVRGREDDRPLCGFEPLEIIINVAVRDDDGV